jgi:polysaccharide pyruvyl transferase CsaB
MDNNNHNTHTRNVIMISGWYGVDNAGDDAILEQFITEIADKRSQHLYVLSEHPERVAQRYGGDHVTALAHNSIRPGVIMDLLRGDLKQHLRLLSQCQLFVLGGGGILRDNTSWRNVIRILDEIWIAKLLGINVAIYAVGAGPFQSRLGKWLFSRTLRLCNIVTVREESSRAQLAAIGVNPRRVIAGADPALLLPSRPVEDIRLREQLISMSSLPRTVGLFVEEDYTPVAEVASALDKLHKENNWRFVSLPMRCHEGRDDRYLARLLQKQMKHPEALYTVDVPLSPSELKWAAGQFRFNITVRLHALIFSLSMGVPAVALNYEPKVAAFLKSFNLDDCCIDLVGDVTGTLVEKALHCASQLPAYEKRIAARLQERCAAARLMFTVIEQLLDGHAYPELAPQCVKDAGHPVV